VELVGDFSFIASDGLKLTSTEYPLALAVPVLFSRESGEAAATDRGSFRCGNFGFRPR
jgi:hypothetical protein